MISCKANVESLNKALDKMRYASNKDCSKLCMVSCLFFLFKSNRKLKHKSNILTQHDTTISMTREQSAFEEIQDKNMTKNTSRCFLEEIQYVSFHQLRYDSNDAT